MKRILTRVGLVFAIIVFAAGVGVLWYLRPRSHVLLSNGENIQRSAETSRIREVLWEPPVRLEKQINIPTDVYEPCISADGQTLYFVRGKAKKNADIFECK